MKNVNVYVCVSMAHSCLSCSSLCQDNASVLFGVFDSAEIVLIVERQTVISISISISNWICFTGATATNYLYYLCDYDCDYPRRIPV